MKTRKLVHYDPSFFSVNRFVYFLSLLCIVVFGHIKNTTVTILLVRPQVTSNSILGIVVEKSMVVKLAKTFCLLCTVCSYLCTFILPRLVYPGKNTSHVHLLNFVPLIPEPQFVNRTHACIKCYSKSPWMFINHREISQNTKLPNYLYNNTLPVIPPCLL